MPFLSPNSVKALKSWTGTHPSPCKTEFKKLKGLINTLYNCWKTS